MTAHYIPRVAGVIVVPEYRMSGLKKMSAEVLQLR